MGNVLRYLLLIIRVTANRKRLKLCRRISGSRIQKSRPLFERLGVDRAYVIGTSGGALVGLNLALERPGLVIKLICDSFIGEKIPVEMAGSIKQARLAEKNGEMGFGGR